MQYSEYCENMSSALDLLEVTEDKKIIDNQQAFTELVALSLKSRDANRQVFFVGNGASASMASHTALDFWKHAAIRAFTFNDLVSLTATSNDYSFEEVFSKPLSFFGTQGDILVCISSSGRSPNVLKAAEVAKEKGMYVVTLSAMDSDNPLRSLGDLNFYVPAMTYGHAEAAHQVLLHFWVDKIMHT